MHFGILHSLDKFIETRYYNPALFYPPILLLFLWNLLYELSPFCAQITILIVRLLFIYFLSHLIYYVWCFGWEKEQSFFFVFGSLNNPLALLFEYSAWHGEFLAVDYLS
jgi:hypothetical protein